jgi:hypothetical protein
MAPAVGLEDGALGARMGFFPPADGPSAFWPGRQIQVLGDLCYLGAFSWLHVLAHRFDPRLFGDFQDGETDRFGEIEADGELQPRLDDGVDEIVARPCAVGPDQYLDPIFGVFGFRFDGQLVESLLEQGDMIGGVVRPGPAGPNLPASASLVSSQNTSSG